MVYAWGLWKTRHERLREKLHQEARDDLRRWLRDGGSVEEWLNRPSQGNGSKPDKP